MRNFLFAAAFAEQSKRKFFGVLAIAPEATSTRLVEQVESFREQVLLTRYRDRIRFLTYERLIHYLRKSRDAEADDLARFLEERIKSICG